MMTTLGYFLFGGLFLLIANLLSGDPGAIVIAVFGWLMVLVGCIDCISEGRIR